jgi:hypothetical protein
VESIFNQLFWLWAPLSLLPEWLRIGVVVFLLIMLARPIIMSLIPFVIIILFRGIKKIHHGISYAVMSLISRILNKRRKAGKGSVPFWVDLYETLCDYMEKGINSILKVLRKRPEASGKVKVWTFWIAISSAVLLSLAITKNPEEWYASKWQKADTWLTVDKLEKELEFKGNEFLASVNAKVKESPDDVETFYILTDEYKDGGAIRESPALDGAKVTEISMDQTVLYLNEEETDSRGIIWLKVRTEDGKVGWISSKIIELYER